MSDINQHIEKYKITSENYFKSSSKLQYQVKSDIYIYRKALSSAVTHILATEKMPSAGNRC